MNAINAAQQSAAEAKRYNITFPTLLCRDTGVIRDFEVTKLPQLFIIDQKGIIQASALFLDTEKIKVVLDKLLAAEPVKAETK
jgi:alkyl hydroperoxide reductase subunit AhpC